MSAAPPGAAVQESVVGPFHVDADHINLQTVGLFLESSDYYTLDVASAIGRPAAAGTGGIFSGTPSRVLTPSHCPALKFP